MAGREDYEERKQARIDRLNDAADKAAKERDQKYKISNDLVKDIPLGQPNIRNALTRLCEKSRNAMDQSVRLDEKAKYYSDKADAAESNTAISSDDPEAIVLLKEKIAKLEKLQADMKAVNKYYRKHKTCVGCDVVTPESAKKLDEKMKHAYSWETAPFASYELTSINAKIKAAKERIAKLEQVDDMPDEIIQFEGGKIESDSYTNRVIIRFDERQSEEVTRNLKSNGFRWSPSNCGWQRLRSATALRIACRLCGVDNKKA